jgi:hypothetical protein
MLKQHDNNASIIDKKQWNINDALPSSLLDLSWVQVSQTAELFGTQDMLLAFSTKRGRGPC